MLLSALAGSRGSEEEEGVLANQLISGVATPTSQFKQNPNMWLKLIPSLEKQMIVGQKLKVKLILAAKLTRWRHSLRKHQ